MSDFLWHGKSAKIKCGTIIATIQDGGLRMPDIYTFHQTQKIIYMKNLILEDRKCLNLFIKGSSLEKYVLKHKLLEQYLNGL